MGKYIDLTGQRFGRWTVIRYAGYNKGVQWECVCDCSVRRLVNGQSLRDGRSTSCGCWAREDTAKRKPATTHGGYHTRLYCIWHGMKQRTSPSCSKKQYPLYYGKGIRTCEEWAKSFEAFRDWALAHGYRDDLSIDRINGDGNYEPGNCRWVTMQEQSRHRRVRNQYTGRVRFHAEA